MREAAVFPIILSIASFCVVAAYFGEISRPRDSDICFCQLKGSIEDCSCHVDTVDFYNNVRIYPRLKSMLEKDYFRYYKVNLKQPCPFWADDSRCAIKFCHVQPCSPHELPPAIKGYNENRHDDELIAYKYSEVAQRSDCNGDVNDVNNELGYLNTTISDASYQKFERWSQHDSAQDNFCELNEDGEDAEYVDLLLNPERYTGYKGRSAHRVWHSIYMENCFLPPSHYGDFIHSSKLKGLCLEKRAFYRLISGLHSSINIHLCANYLVQEQSTFGGNPSGDWGVNLAEFSRRFSPDSSGGEGPQWLRNLYFLYLLELRALDKAAAYIDLADFFTGHGQQDQDLRLAVQDLLNVIQSFPNHFDERTMFIGGEEGTNLKRDFQESFRNISRIMDCVGCDKCKLWGKLQIHGIGTALKILFSGRYDDPAPTRLPLRRWEIVALFNSFGRLSTSIHELEHFRQMMR